MVMDVTDEDQVNAAVAEVVAAWGGVDVLVVNTSATMPAAVAVAGAGLAVHFSTELASGRWLVEPRRVAGRATEPYPDVVAGQGFPLFGGGAVTAEM